MWSLERGRERDREAMMASQDPGRWYKRATAVVCACNLVTVLCIIYVLFITTSSSLSASRVLRHGPQGSRLTAEEAAQYRASLEARRAMEPVKLIKRVKEIREEFNRAEMRNPKSAAARKKYAAEIAERLKQLKESNATKHQQALEEWKRKKLVSKKDIGVQNNRKQT